MTTESTDNATLPTDDVLPESMDDEDSENVTTEAPESPFGDEVTEEDVEQLMKERAERLDPKNRPANAEVNNTDREWVTEKEDFRDNLEGNPPEWDKSDGAGTVRDSDIMPPTE